MGVYIDGLDMPKSCKRCPFTCEALQFFNGKGRPQSCPLIEIDLVRCGECKKVDTKKCPMYSAGWGYTDDDWCSEGERRDDGDI